MYYNEENKMSLNHKLTSEQYPELFEYACHVLKENPKCSEIMRWVREHSYKLENFFLAYTLMKHGKYDKNSYKDVINKFKEKHKIELEEAYSNGFHSHRLWSYKD